MSLYNAFNQEIYRRQNNFSYRSGWQRWHIDLPLLTTIIILASFGLIILYSASYQDGLTVARQGMRLLLAFGIMFICAQIPPYKYKSWTPWLYIIGTFLLLLVLITGKIGKGAQRWLELGLFRFQPSEILKLAVPMMLAWYFSHFPIPPKFKHIIVAVLLVLIPSLLIIKQPDLGTALMIIMSGGCVLLFAGISWRLLISIFIVAATAAPLLWHRLHDYQQQRVLTFLDPERDPLGNGYHIIQSKIAIGSGGLFGKGWLNGSQSQLEFLPEHATDFIFAVCGEEFGLIGSLVLLSIVIVLVGRALYIATHAKDTFSRLLASSLALTFFMSVFVNVGMVTGILPVVGLPFPLVSYGGTSIVTTMASFGILMSIHTHRKLLPS